MAFVGFFENLKNETESDDYAIFKKAESERELSESGAERIIGLFRKYLEKRLTVCVLVLVFLVLCFAASPEICAIYLVCMIMLYISVFYYPQIRDGKNYSDINQELPYALRHMGIELKSGKGLHDALLTVKNADYGSLSKEFTRVLEEIKFGRSTEDSLLEMAHRINSEGLTRAVQQIVGTLRVGGNLAGNLEIIANDISFEMQIKLKEYSQKLNSFILIYTFIAILTPVISLIMLMASSTVMGDVVSKELLFLIYTVFFPMTVMFMAIFIKKMEPQI